MKYIIADIKVKADGYLSYITRWQFYVQDIKNIEAIVEKYFQKILELKNMKILSQEIISISDNENLEFNTISIFGPKYKHQI